MEDYRRISKLIRDFVSGSVLSKQRANVLWRNIKGGLPRASFPKRYFFLRRR